MNRSVILALCIMLFFITSSLNAQNWLQEINQQKEFDFKELQSVFNNYWKDKKPSKGSGFKQFKRMEWLLAPRLWKTNQIPDLNNLRKEYLNYFAEQKQSPKMLANADWKFVGPTNKPSQQNGMPPPGIGRISCLAFHPLNNAIIYVGSATGGIWKTTDAGNSWTNLPLTGVLSIGISDIAISTSNPNIIYASTGDAEASGFLGVNYSFSIGILKSTDAGITWNTTSSSYEISQKTLINRILVHPSNPNLIYYGSNRGFSKSTNGGTTWMSITGDVCRDLEFKSDDPSTIYGTFISASNVYSIRKYSESAGNLAIQLEINDAGRINLATCKSQPNILYALVCSNYPNYNFHSVWKTTNGSTWTKVADKSTSPNYLTYYANGSGTAAQGLYDLSIAVNPSNADEVYLGGVNIWKSTNGGIAFSPIAEWTGGFGLPWVHADIHWLEFNSNNILYACTDGGINRSTNFGKNWIDISNGLQITQFYSLSKTEQNPNIITAGAQDNGTHKFDGTNWKNILGGDGMGTIIDNTNSNIIYASLYYGEINKSTDGGNNFTNIISPDRTGEEGAWVTPYLIHPSNPNTIYVAMQNVWKTTNGGSTWVKISNFNESMPIKINSMAISSTDPNYIYISKYNQLYKTSSGGGTWTSVGQTQDYITSIMVHPSSPSKFWVTLSGYSGTDKVLFFNGTKWDNISAGLPNVPVNCIEYQKNSLDRLYIGTDVGVFTRDNSSAQWESYNQGLPNVIINDLKILNSTSKMYAATYGRGIWETKINDCNLAAPELIVTGLTKFCYGDSVKLEAKDSYPSYKWSNGATTKTIWIKTSATINLTVTDLKNCSATSTDINITVTNPPDYSIKLIGKNPFCEGEGVELQVNSFGYKYYKWSTGDSIKKITVLKPGTYSVVCTTIDGCTKAATNTITLTSLPAPAKPVVTQNNGILTSSTAVSYQWYLDGNIISGETKQSYTTKSNGKYQVEITDANGCTSKSDEYVITTGVNPEKIIKVSISPNPGTGLFKLIIPSSFGNTSVEITNIMGQLIGTIILNEGVNETEIDLNNYPDGIYFINLKNQSNSSINKIIKESN